MTLIEPTVTCDAADTVEPRDDAVAPRSEWAEPSSVAELRIRAGDLLLAVGSRRTAGRVALVAVMLQAGARHLTAAELQELLRAQGWAIDPSAIHRATAVLTEGGLLHTLPTPGPTAYGLALPHHHHAVCTGCDTIIAIPDVDPDAELAAVAAQRMLEPSGFRPDPGGLNVRGRCRRCLDRTA